MCGAGTTPWVLGALPCSVSRAPGNDGRRAHAPQQHGWPHHVRGLPFARERREGAARGDDASAACAAAGRHPGSSSSGGACAHDAGAAISRPFAGGEGSAGRSPLSMRSSRSPQRHARIWVLSVAAQAMQPQSPSPRVIMQALESFDRSFLARALAARRTATGPRGRPSRRPAPRQLRRRACRRRRAHRRRVPSPLRSPTWTRHSCSMSATCCSTSWRQHPRSARGCARWCMA